MRTLIITLLLIFAPAGCGRVISPVPLSDLDSTKPDRDLEGVWVRSEGDRVDKRYKLTISTVRGKQRGRFVMNDPGQNQGPKEAVLYIYPTQIAGQRFASVQAAPDSKRRKEDKKYETNYVPVIYDIKSDRLYVAELSSGFLDIAIEDGKLKGKVEHIDIAGRYVYLEESTESLRKFLNGNVSDIRKESDFIEFSRNKQ